MIPPRQDDLIRRVKRTIEVARKLASIGMPVEETDTLVRDAIEGLAIQGTHDLAGEDKLAFLTFLADLKAAHPRLFPPSDHERQ